MNKSDFIQNIAARLPEIPTRDVDHAARLLLELMASTLETGGRCEIRGFGTFSVRTRPGRKARNPMTGESVSVPRKTCRLFQTRQAIKSAANRINGGYSYQGIS